ncbi:diacylglycerol kinase [Vibrio panuliri]|uniref:Dihydrofolate reductase n=2 Tax=Vibrio panuliri TaxID=1381081 RepID=A0A1Q9HCU6_9VIBR|nr:type 3 dihydrofolate reductase [Vibrio panuliri]OLQ87201.1 diacylglycerol kinase [Vibrio panuliri]
MFAPESISRVIGNENSMPWHLPADFAWFRKHTLGKPVIMGRKTYESIGKPLPDRHNIVISRDSSLVISGVTVVSSVEDALAAAGNVKEVMVIGGGSIYEAFLPLSQKLYLTFIEADIAGDTRFPVWDSEFIESHSETYDADDKNPYDMSFVILEKSKI